ncbi:CLUMA_CG015531, isoform A [Clunio marinus]|uniref:CLUMA_CG015531, isoform A n=1 Tax=Clunio marinus TaxID=568069 RepID=A0A1J1IP46_9DIPT|nr:CLUMA_CG015531, isoform A [Clunio marinus]
MFHSYFDFLLGLWCGCNLFLKSGLLIDVVDKNSAQASVVNTKYFSDVFIHRLFKLVLELPIKTRMSYEKRSNYA